MPRFPDTVFQESFNYGGMFNGEAGVRLINGKYHGYVADGWGQGRQGPAKETLELAKKDIERIKKLDF